VGFLFIVLELREGAGEIEAVAMGALFELVSCEDIRGDLHMYMIYSDGVDMFDVMVVACCAFGYQYFAIIDHSECAGVARMFF